MSAQSRPTSRNDDDDELQEAVEANVSRLDAVRRPANGASFLLLRSLPTPGATPMPTQSIPDGPTAEDIRRNIAEIAKSDPQKAAELGMQHSHALLTGMYRATTAFGAGDAAAYDVDNARDMRLRDDAIAEANLTPGQRATQQATESAQRLADAQKVMAGYKSEIELTNDRNHEAHAAVERFRKECEAGFRRRNPGLSDDLVKQHVSVELVKLAHAAGPRR